MAEQGNISDGQVLDEILDTLDLLVERLDRLEKKVEATRGGGDSFVTESLEAIEEKLLQLDVIQRRLDSVGAAPGGPATAAPEGLAALERKIDAVFAAVRKKEEATPTATAAPVHANPLQAKLDDPAVAAGLARILDRIDALETTARTLETLAHRAPILIDGAAETADHFMMEAEAAGIDVFDRGLKGAAVLEKATRPENIALVDELLDHAGTVRFAARVGTRAVAALGDQEKASDAISRLAAKGGAVLTSPVLDKVLAGPLMDPARLERSVDALSRLVELSATPEFQRLLDSGLLDPQVLGTAGSASTALVQAKKDGYQPVGMFGVLGRMGDPDVQKAMGFLFAVAKAFGSKV